MSKTKIFISSVQIMIFRDRLEIINPGALPLGWSVDKLKKPHASVPFNPLLAEPMYLKGYIERMGTGTADMIRIAEENNLKEPLFEQNEDFTTIIYRQITNQVTIKNSPSMVEGQNSLKFLGNIDFIKGGKVNEGVNEGVKKELITILKFLQNKPFRKTKEIAEHLGKGISTVERYLKILKEHDLIRFDGAPKTGGYKIK
jgi:ATP-dependent DNA helicase RecG